jgi:hypothetical protein
MWLRAKGPPLKHQLMRNRKIILSLLLTAVISITCVRAQQQAIDHMTQVMTDSLAYLKLNDQQKTSAQQLNKTAATALVQLAQKAKTDTSLHGDALFKQVMGIMKQRNTELVKILDKQQQQLYEQHQLARLAELQTKMMTTQLGLSDAQAAQVYPINLESLTEMKEKLEELQGAKRKMQKLRKARSIKGDMADKDKELKKILTQTQYDKYIKNKEAMKAAMKEKMQDKKG